MSFEEFSEDFESSSPKARKNANGSFQERIKKLIDHFNKSHSSELSLQSICERYSFERRRFYDVINILEGIGCIKKLDSDRMIWYGIGNVKKNIKRLVKKHVSAPANEPIQNLLKISKTCSIISLTNTYMLSFIALQTREVSLMELANIIAQFNKRYKSTLCKLYQISQIMRAMGVVEFNSRQGLPRLTEDYYNLIMIPEDNNNARPFSIQWILEKDEQCISMPNILDQRRKLFRQCVST